MDYDENDFQSQNQHLAGEGNAKFSPALQPYALSKFDFDDNLQGHLRFDSLVESEVFLGIANNVDNHWIEDFSRGNSGIEFSTCATVPCSITRHNNVWSEATSSESVEMLLKSVGQEETALNPTTIEAANACNPAATTKEMEPNVTHDDSVFSNSEETVNPQSTLVSDEILQNCSSIKEAIVDELSQVEVASRTHNELFVGGMSVDVDSSTLDGNSVASKAEGSSSNNDRSDDKIQGEFHHGLQVKPSNDSAQDAGSSFDVRGDNVVRVTDLIVMSSNKVESQIAVDQVSVVVENVDGLQTDSDVQGREMLAVSMEERRNRKTSADNAVGSPSSHLDYNANLSLKGQYKEEGNAVGTGVSIDQEASTIRPPIMEGCAGDASGIVSAKGAGTVGHIEAEGKNDAVIVEPAVTGSEQSMDSNQRKMIMHTDTIGNNDDKSDYNEQQTECSTASLLKVDDDKVLEKDSEGINGVSGLMLVGSLPRQHEKTQSSDLSKDAEQDVSGEKGSQSSSLVEVKQVERESEAGNFSLSSEDIDRNDVHHHKEAQISSGQELESTAIDNLEECEIQMHADASSGTAEKQSSETVSEVKPVSDSGNKDIIDASQATVSMVVDHETDKEPKGSLDLCEPTVNKGDHIEAVPKKQEDAVEEIEKELKDSEDLLKASESFPKSSPSSECHVRSRVQEDEIDNADSNKVECSSPIVISSSELSQDVNIEEADKNSSHQNLPSSDVKDSNVLVDQKGMDAAKDEKSFTFDVSALMTTEGSKKWQQFPTVKDSKLYPIVEGSPSTPALVQVENKVLQPNTTGSPRKSRDTVRGHTKDMPERKARRTSSKSAAKESAKKGNSVKATAALKQLEAGVSSYRSLSPSGIYQVVPSNEMQHFGQVDGTNAKPFGVISTAVSSLPDLNASAFPNVVFQQPFTDLQQVQLRAQIFVYGSLISKVAPEEAHMLSAFGGPDGGRSIWENAWRKCRERVLGQTIHPASIETPSQSRLASDHATKQNIVPNKVTPSPVGRGSGKSTPSPATNTVLPLSSPLWNISTPSFEALQSLPKGAGRDYQHAFSPVHLNQNPSLGNYFGHSTTWMSQTPFHASWSTSPQTSVLDPSVRFPLLPMTEAVKLAPVKESPVSLSSAMKNVAPGPVIQDAVQATVLPGSSVASLDGKKVAASPGQPSTDSKSRKRKKPSTSGDLSQVMSHSQSLVEPSSIATPTSLQPVPVPAANITVFFSENSMGKHNVSAPLPVQAGDSKAGEQDKKSVLPEESIIKVKEARKQAEDAAVFAAAAIGRSQEIWSHLNKQKDSGLIAAAEVTLASAAVAVAAAASVAKAAAAAASVASNAALQAKLMAEEALNPSSNNQIPNDGFSLSALGVTSSSSLIFAAKEAARKRIEAASAASLRAENLDAIVKAAELASEAISQAGKVVTMGDSFPISELIEAGPDGFWKMPLISSNHGADMHDGNRDRSNNSNTYGRPDASGKQLAGPFQDKGTSVVQHALPPTSGGSLRDKSEKHGSLMDGGSSLVNSDGKKFRRLKDRKAPEMARTTGGNFVSIVSHEELDETLRTSKESGITEGSQVEVFKDGDGFKAAWFSASVLSLKDGKVHLCYSEIPSNEGSGKLKEWVELGSVGDKAPRVRVAHPMTAMKSEGTRKRRRAAMGDFTCSVGDKVDAWMRDSWWEGEVTEKSNRDGTSVTVHFPAHGETSVVRTWQLRPSLMWKDGEWIEWSSMRENVQTHREGDMPQEKRARLGTPGLESKGKDKVQESVQVVEPENPQVVESLNLTAKEKTFNIGKKNTIESRMDRLKSARTGLRKEGSRVVIGVPKPGKKRKFMEVSKHYVGNQKTDELNDSVKLANYLMPQRSGPRGWKNFSKDDTKEKRMVDSKPKILRSGRSQNVSSRAILQKNNLTTAGSSYGTLPGIKSKDSSNHCENASEKQNSTEHGSFSNSEGVTEGPISSLVPSSDASSLKRTLTTGAKPERANKGKATAGKLSTREDKSFNGNAANATSEAVEPRRSNRRIQPTSRLLEGLQSSMIIPKMPSTSHDRGHRSQSKGTSKRE